MADLGTEVASATSDDTGVRTGTVSSLSPFVVSIQGGTVNSPGSLQPNVGVGDTVALLRQGDSWLCLGNVGPATLVAANANWTTAGSVATSPAGGGEVAVPSASWAFEPTFIFKQGRVYRIIFYSLLTSTGSPTAVTKIRKGQATITGTILGQASYVPAITTCSYTQVFYVKNNSGSDISTKLSATVQHFTIGATASLYGDAQQPMYVLAEDAGSIADQGFASLAIEI